LKGLSAKEIKGLVHELRIHQVELEMQNDKLRRTQLELQAAHDEYTDLYEFSPVGYITTSSDELILKANLTLSTLLGIEKTALIGAPLSLFVSKEAQDLFYFYRKKLIETGGAWTCEIVMVKADGSRFDAQLDSIQVSDAAGRARHFLIQQRQPGCLHWARPALFFWQLRFNHGIRRRHHDNKN
jgi:PAS domain S-box-containing protein